MQPKPPKEDKGPPPPFEPWFAIRKGEYKPIKVCLCTHFLHLCILAPGCLPALLVLPAHRLAHHTGIVMTLR